MNRLLPDSWKILNRSERINFGLTGLTYFLSSLFDLALVSLTIPFINALNEEVQPNSIILLIFRLFRADTYYKQNTTTAILLLLITALGMRFFLKVAAVELETRFKNRVTSRLTSLLYETYITNSFEFHKRNESTHLTNNILNTRQINDFIYEPWLKIYYECISILLIFLFLFVVSPIVSLTGVILIGILLIIYQSISKKKIAMLSDITLKSDISTLKIIKDSLLSLSEVKIYHKEKYFKQIFKKSIDIGIISRNRNHQLHVMAPITMEFLGLFISFLIICLLLQSDRDGTQLIPIISSFVVALFRLIPGASGLQSALHRIHYGKRQLENPLLHIANQDKSFDKIDLSIKPDCTLKYVIFDSVRFLYPGNDAESVSCSYLKINAGSFTGVVGSSGAGKSTFIQLLLGLLKPDSGQITFWDDQSNQIDLSALTVGYVPQEVHLLNSSLSANVAFGVQHEDIDLNRVVKCLRDVQLDYLLDRFDLCDNQPMGEDGSSVSGGERQRIGLARALYPNPSLLILDEVTSSLDQLNEALILDLISELFKEMTTVLVTHRIEAIKKCNCFVRIENGLVT